MVGSFTLRRGPGHFARRWALAVALLAALPCAHAQGSRIVIMAGGIDKLIYLPARLAQQLGYFRQEGLNVVLLSEPSGVNAQDVLLVGTAQGVIGAYDHAVELQAKGKAVQSVVQFTLAPGEVELVSAHRADAIRSPADFKGRRLGVTGLGSSTSFLTQYLAAQHQLKPGDFTLVPVGSGRTFIAAMTQGHIDAGMTTEPTATLLLASGAARVLVDLRTPEATLKALGGLYPFACLYMQASWIRGHRPQVQKLANALVRALRYIQGHGAEDIAAQLPGDYSPAEKAMYIQSLAASKSMFTVDGVMPAAGPPTVLKVLSVVSRSVRGKRVDLAKTYTTEFVKAAQ